MDLVQSRHQSGSEPEFLELRFPDRESHGTPVRRGYPSPRSEWRALATEKAEELGIEFGMKNTKNGLKAAFHTADDCNALIAAMQGDWPARLKRGIEGNIYMASILESMGNGSALETAREMAKIYELDEAEVVAMVPDSEPV